MNRIKRKITKESSRLLNLYFTAGYPQLQDTITIAHQLATTNKVDIIEIGMPYSDPLADGPTIQASGSQALANGMTIQLLFEQIVTIRQNNELPIVLMGYFNQVMQYGEEAFFKKCKQVGVDGLILPDLPLHEYEEKYKTLVESLDLTMTFLVTPQTPVERIREIDRLSSGFIYLVADASVTGGVGGINDMQIAYFQRIRDMQLNNPLMIGFGISNATSFDTACQYANGAIIGSAFIRALGQGTSAAHIDSFVHQIKK